MNIFKFLTLILLFVYGGQLFAQSHSTYSPAILNRIDSVENNLISWVKLDQNMNIYQRMKELNINGAVVAVIQNYKIEWVKAYGWADTATKRPMKNNTLFQAASVGKSINGFGYMKLVQNKVVNLN